VGVFGLGWDDREDGPVACLSVFVSPMVLEDDVVANPFFFLNWCGNTNEY
jgi:hypothetical protein